jgi:hypothetical protein
MAKSIKFLGGKITLRESAKDQVLPSGAKASWDQALVIEVGKSKLALGRDCLKKLNELVSDEDNVEFFKTLPE